MYELIIFNFVIWAQRYFFFKGLKMGDVNTIKQCISGKMYNEVRILLEKNRAYPEFLKRYYQGAIFSVEKLSRTKPMIIVEVVIEFRDGVKRTSMLYLKERIQNSSTKTTSKKWEIFDQRYD